MGIISTAYAADAAAQQGGGLQMIFLLVIFGLIFYFMIFRPQSKRNKQHRELMSSLAKGEEVLTSGGLLGKITILLSPLTTLTKLLSKKILS